MRTESGFTLIEVLFTGVISTVLAGVSLTILYMNTSQIRQTTTGFRLAQIHGIISQEIQLKGRSSDQVRSTSVPPGPLVGDSPAVSDISFLYEGVTIGAFRVQNGYLEEWVGGSFQKVKIAGDSVQSLNATPFAILDGRLGARFNLDLQITLSGTAYQLRSPTEIVQCRSIEAE